MALNIVPAVEVIARLHEFDTVIDARTEDEYVEKVISLASNPDYLNTLRMGQRNQMQNSKLMDETGFCRKVEAAYRSMWQTWCEQ